MVAKKKQAKAEGLTHKGREYAAKPLHGMTAMLQYHRRFEEKARQRYGQKKNSGVRRPFNAQEAT